MTLLSFSVGNIVGTEIFLPKDAPGYIPGKISIMVLLTLQLLLSFVLKWINLRLNKKKVAQVEELKRSKGWTDADVQKERERHAFMDLTDHEYVFGTLSHVDDYWQFKQKYLFCIYWLKFDSADPAQYNTNSSSSSYSMIWVGVWIEISLPTFKHSCFAVPLLESQSCGYNQTIDDRSGSQKSYVDLRHHSLTENPQYFVKKPKCSQPITKNSPLLSSTIVIRFFSFSI